jgi:hypothetical protein
MMFSFANSSTAVTVNYIEVTAKIDGSDWFEMTGNQWRWQHRNYVVPEYHEGVDATVVKFEGITQSFLSEWPDGQDLFDYSAYNTVLGLKPIQDVIDPATITLEKISGRGLVQLQQTPAVDNNYTFRVFFDDDGPGGHDFYTFRINGDKWRSLT